MKQEIQEKELEKLKEIKHPDERESTGKEKNEVGKSSFQFKIPFTVQPIDKLKIKSEPFLRFVRPAQKSRIRDFLVNSDVPISREQYIALCIRKLFFNFVLTFFAFGVIFFFSKVQFFYVYSFIIASLFSGFVFLTEINYPKLYDSRRQRIIERNLIPALQDMLVQLNAGIPLFNIMANISNADYKALSIEFKKAVKKIGSGSPQLTVLEELGEKNSSIFFRRTLWQISNGMRAGSDIAIVIRESVRSLTEEQLIQIQNYGNKLNPLIMFYMLISVIIPALSITFLTVISSMVGLSSQSAILLFGTLFVMVVIIQVSFVGIVRSVRPTLF